VITINMNNAALCRLEQQDRALPGARSASRATTASAGLPDARGGAPRPRDARGTAPRPQVAPPMPEHTRG
jgi:hypothetical protein